MTPGKRTAVFFVSAVFGTLIYMTKSVRRLAELFTPAHYTLNIDISNRIGRVFTGTATISGNLPRNERHIILHAKGLTVTAATIDDVTAHSTPGADDELILSNGHDLARGEHVITLHFNGAITDPMHGLYPCYFTEDGTAKELLMTQLESHSARELFPCIDEPVAKATYQLTLTTEPGVTVLSNTPAQKTTEQAGMLVTTFEPTPKMSTYLLAFVVGELAYQETTNKHGVTVRAYATKAHKHKLGFALEHASKFLDFYDDFFGTPYPLQKCDLVACPDFAAGAMENWGLITFREAAMLIDEKDTSAEQHQYVAGVVAHELAHQWFGNLVTMAWWDHLWLNESFANYMETYVPAHFYPEWQLWEQYAATDQQYALARDGLATVQAVQQHVNHPDEIATLFDPAIVYAKGGSLIQMLHEYIGDEVFRKGMAIYMQRHKYSNTTTEDLWKALGEASGKDIEQFMGDWVGKPGHPVLSYEIEDTHATITQKRFYANPAQTPPEDDTLWPVPLLSSTLPDAGLLTTRFSKFVVEPADYHLINEGGTGFYHVRYDPKTLARIARAVTEGKLQPSDRQRLLMDSVALNRAGVETTLDTLRLLSHYDREDNYAVWLAINAATNALRILVNEDARYKPDLQRFIAGLTRAEFERLGWEAKKGEAHFDTLLRPFVIGNMVYAHDPSVDEHCQQLFKAARRPEDIPSDIRAIVYSAAVYRHGQPAVDKLLAWYKATISADERVNIVAGLSSVQDADIAKTLIGLVSTKTVKLQDSFYWFIYFIRSKHGRMPAWHWMQQNWDWITKNFGGDHDFGMFPKYAGSAFSTSDELHMYKDFFAPKLKVAALTRTITQGFEDIETRMLWRERDLESVVDFLKKD